MTNTELINRASELLAEQVREFQKSGEWVMLVSPDQRDIHYHDDNGDAYAVDLPGYIPGAIVIKAQWQDSYMVKLFGEEVFIDPERLDVVQTGNVVVVDKTGNSLIPVAMGKGMGIYWYVNRLNNLTSRKETG